MWGYESGKNAFGFEPKSYASQSEEGSGVVQKLGSSVGTGPLMTNNDWTWAYGSPSDMKQQYQSGGSSRGSSRGGGYAGGTGDGSAQRQQTVTRLRFQGEAPDMPTLPKLEMPKMDKRKIRALTQELAAPQMRKLQESLQGAMNVHSDNPNVRRMTLREALQGYGSGLESVQAGAGQQARQEHQQDLSLQSAEAQANYQAAVNAAMAQYNNAWQKYLASAERVTESEGVTGPAAGGVPGATMVVRRNVWGTPYLAPDFQTAWKTRTPTSW